jgi:hypothetical protein
MSAYLQFFKYTWHMRKFSLSCGTKNTVRFARFTNSSPHVCVHTLRKTNIFTQAFNKFLVARKNGFVRLFTKKEKLLCKSCERWTTFFQLSSRYCVDFFKEKSTSFQCQRDRYYFFASNIFRCIWMLTTFLSFRSFLSVRMFKCYTISTSWASSLVIYLSFIEYSRQASFTSSTSYLKISW